MWDFNIGRALQLMVKTLPFLGLRLAIYVGIALGYVLVTGIGIGTGYGLGALGGADVQPSAAIWGGLIGFGLFGAFMCWAREYLLYLLKAGHIAVLTSMLHGNPLPENASQLAYASGVVKARFAQVSIVHAFLRMAVGFADDVILARTIHTDSDNPWSTARDSLILYGQNYKVMRGTGHPPGNDGQTTLSQTS